jgi:hypothetical protein
MKSLWTSGTRATIPFLSLERGSSETFLDTVRLPLQGWHELERKKTSITWGNAKDQFRMLELITGHSGFPPINAASIHDYRRVVRQNSLERGHGILEVQASNIGGFNALKTITKYPLEHQRGFGYNGWLCIPMPDQTLNMYSKALEQNVSDQRAVVIGAMITNQQINANPDSSTWICDPYDSEFDEVALHHLTDEARFDDFLPDHPLTLVRKDLELLEHHTVFGV